MRITFDAATPQKLETTISAYSTDSPSKKGIGSSYEILSSFEDNKSYDGSKKSLTEFRNTIQATDVEITQDYMAVLSGCMSDKDFGEMLKSGKNPATVEIRDSVTILDRIKLEVAKSGTTVEGFTDTLDSETVEAMTGLKNLASEIKSHDASLDEQTCEEIKEAVDLISDVTEMTEGMKKSLVMNDEAITIDNLYLAKHSSAKELREQGSEYFAIETPGYLAKKGESSDFSNLVEEIERLLETSGIEVSKENVSAARWLVENSVAVTEKSVEKYKEIVSVTFPLTDEKISKAIAIAIAEGRAPKEADVTKTETVYEAATRITSQIEKLLDEPSVKATRVMEEIRLKMTTEANLMLIKSDYHIDTKNLEKYVEALKEIEESTQYKEVLEVSKVSETVETVKKLPAAVIAPIAREILTVSLEDVVKIGAPIKANYDAAVETYEQVGTQVRTDLGDSIKKAFRNVSDILSEMGLENTNDNQRAVRILGYNNMPITEESIDEIKEADKKLQNVISRITPKDTLSLIREGRSPIQMSVDELNEYLDKSHDVQKEEIEKYSKFLYKLERDKEITPEERADYIEVYRFFHQIEKTGAAAVGAVVNAGQEFTISNLKTALKTAKHKGMDVTIGDVYDTLMSTDSDNTLEADWISHKYHEMKEALSAGEEAVSELVMNNVYVSAENLEAALLLRKKRGEAFKTASSVSGGKAKERELAVSEKLNGRDEAADAYSEMVADCKEAIYEECMQKETYMDVRALQLVHMQMSVAQAYSENENYEVPMEIGGQVTAVNVKLMHNSKEDPNVVVSLETEELGRISARLYTENEKINGYIACNLKETVTKMQKVADKINTGISVVWSTNSDSDLALAKIPMRENDSQDASGLYRIAKQFLESMKGII